MKIGPRHLWLLFFSFMALRVDAAYVLTPLVQTLDAPVDIVVDPRDPAAFLVLEQAGRIVKLKNGKIEAAPVLDIRGKVTSGGEMGLLGIAVPKDFESRPRYFINYTTTENDQPTTVIAEISMTSGEERRYLSYKQPFTNHNGGGLAFDEKGFLFIGTGDGGSAGDPFGNGQNNNSLLGKMLRIDVNQADPKRNTLYSIPKDNPFASGGGLPEIYAWGLRNPWRYSFDRVTGLLFAGDVGQNALEEIDIVEKGKNYGWNTMEGTKCFKPKNGCNQSGLVLPIHEYPRRDGYSITGGFVYRGKKIPELSGWYVYADYGTGKIWALSFDAEKKKMKENKLLLASGEAVSSFGVDADGELLVLGYAGKVMRLENRLN